jgi:hypothetical protein
MGQRTQQRNQILTAYDYLQKDMGSFNPSTDMIEPPSSIISIAYENSTVTSNLPKILNHNLYSTPLLQTICKAEKWSHDTFHKVDWKAYDKAFTSVSRCKQISLSKLSHNLLNTNYQNQKYYGHPDTCPCCDKQLETFSHMLSCSSDSSTLHRQNLLEQLQKEMLKINIPKSITSAIIHGISQWCIQQLDPSQPQRSPTYGSLVPLDIAITQAYTDQTRLLGWDNLLRGRLSILWG